MQLQRNPVVLALAAAMASGCLPDPLPLAARQDATAEQALSDATRLERATLIRDAAGEKGVTAGVLIAGIGQAETGLAHCDSEVGYGCPGPASPSCGGEPILAGGADGPCSAEQGGLGMFQFDSGTYQQTLATYGDEVLTIEGNAGFAVEFMIARIILSAHVDGVDTREQAIAWINSVEPGGANWDAWLTSVTHYYNGCSPTGCSLFDSRYDHYRTATLAVLDEFGADFWADIGNLPEPPVCEPIPAAGRVIEEDDDCYQDGGDATYWHTAQDGSGGRLRFTETTDSQAVENFGVWQLDFASAGRYAVEVYTDADFGQSRQASYLVSHAGTDTEVIIDQAALDGFQLLGVFDFAAGANQQVRLDDNTGEPWSASDGIRLVFDALRVTPADVPPDDPPPDDPPPDDPPPDDPPPDDPSAEQHGDDDGTEPLGPSLNSSCAATPTGSLASCALLTIALRYARRRTRLAGMPAP